jgi:FkbM family methyltransferase
MFKLFSYLYRYIRALGFREGLAAFAATYLRRGPIFEIRRSSGKIYLRDNPSDRFVFREVFIERGYDTSWWKQDVWLQRRYKAILAAGHVPLIIDAGANIGMASLWFSEQFPLAKVFAIEPERGNISILARNAVGRSIVPLAGAVWDKTAHLCITNEDAASDAFRVVESEGNGEVRAYSIDEITDMEPGGDLFIVKIDIEGGESALFRSNTGWLEKPALIIIEPHDWLFPGESVTRSFRERIAGLPIDLVLRGENIFCFASPNIGQVSTETDILTRL